MKIRWEKKPEYPKTMFCWWPLTLSLGNSEHKWTQTRVRHTVWMETVLWTPDNTESGFGKGQLETRDGKIYEFTSGRFVDHYYGQRFSLGISLVIIMFITIGPML